MEESLVPKKSLLTSKNIIRGLVGLLIVALIGGFYFYSQATKDPQKEAQKELAAVVAQVGKHIVLPEGETPTLATVSDPSKLKDQPFFANAKQGDKLLIYSKSQKAILYDPKLDRIIEVAPVNLGTTAK